MRYECHGHGRENYEENVKNERRWRGMGLKERVMLGGDLEVG